MTMKASLYLAYAGAVLALLATSYPIWTEISLRREPISHWIVVYLTMTLIITVLGSGLSILSRRAFGPSHRIYPVLAAAFASLVILSGYALLMGRTSAQISKQVPFQYAHAKFFGEFASIKFMVLVAPIVSFFTAFLTYMANKTKG